MPERVRLFSVRVRRRRTYIAQPRTLSRKLSVTPVASSAPPLCVFIRIPPSRDRGPRFFKENVASYSNGAGRPSAFSPARKVGELMRASDAENALSACSNFALCQAQKRKAPAGSCLGLTSLWAISMARSQFWQPSTVHPKSGSRSHLFGLILCRICSRATSSRRARSLPEIAQVNFRFLTSGTCQDEELWNFGGFWPAHRLTQPSWSFTQPCEDMNAISSVMHVCLPTRT